MDQVTVGSYLAQRLEEVGVRDYFAIPGDFNLSLLDERVISCIQAIDLFLI